MTNLVFSLIITLFNLFYLFNCDSNDFSYDFDFDSPRFEEVMLNPYRELGVAPWSSNKVIKERYNELVRLNHPDKSKSIDSREKFMRIQEAYELIKSEREDKIEYTIYDTIRMTSITIVQICVIIFTMYGLVWLCYKMIDLFFRFVVCLITTTLIFERLIPHLFRSLQSQLMCSFVVSLILTYAFRKIYNKSDKNKIKTQ